MQIAEHEIRDAENVRLYAIVYRRQRIGELDLFEARWELGVIFGALRGVVHFRVVARLLEMPREPRARVLQFP